MYGFLLWDAKKQTRTLHVYDEDINEIDRKDELSKTGLLVLGTMQFDEMIKEGVEKL